MKENKLREIKVNELNRILPMITGTIRKETKIIEFRGKVYSEVTEIKKVYDAFSEIEKLNQVLENELEYIPSFSKVLREIEERKEVLNKKIDDYMDTINSIISEYEFEVDLYSQIADMVATVGGFLKKDEIQPDLIVEYIYLLLISDKLTLDTLICDFEQIGDEYFIHMLSKKLNERVAESMIKKQNRSEMCRTQARERLISELS